MLKRSFGTTSKWVSAILNIIVIRILFTILPQSYISYVPLSLYALLYLIYVICTIATYVDYADRMHVSYSYFRSVYALNPKRFSLSFYPIYKVKNKNPLCTDEEVIFLFGAISHIRYLLFFYRITRKTHVKKVNQAYIRVLNQMQEDINQERNRAIDCIEEARGIMKAMQDGKSNPKDMVRQ